MIPLNIFMYTDMLLKKENKRRLTMKTYKRFIALFSTMVLISLFSLNAFAADLDTPSATANDSSENMIFTEMHLYDENGKESPITRSTWGKSTIPVNYTMTFSINGNFKDDLGPLYERVAVINFDKEYKHERGLKLMPSGTYQRFGSEETSDSAIIYAYQVGSSYQFYVTNKDTVPINVTSGEYFSEYMASR